VAELIFYILALDVCACALFTVTSRHIFHSAVWLALCLMGVAGIYFLLGAEFVGVIQVLVYIGGIITLFVFAIKLTAHMDDMTIPQMNKQLIPSAITAFVLFSVLMAVLGSVTWTIVPRSAHISLEELGRSLLTTYVLPFEFISLVLLAVMIGAIVIGRARP